MSNDFSLRKMAFVDAGNDKKAVVGFEALDQDAPWRMIRIRPGMDDGEGTLPAFLRSDKPAFCEWSDETGDALMLVVRAPGNKDVICVLSATQILQGLAWLMDGKFPSDPDAYELIDSEAVVKKLTEVFGESLRDLLEAINPGGRPRG